MLVIANGLMVLQPARYGGSGEPVRQRVGGAQDELRSDRWVNEVGGPGESGTEDESTGWCVGTACCCIAGILLGEEDQLSTRAY